MGHVQQGNNFNIDVKVKLEKFIETWQTNDRAEGLLMDGAGFRAQDALGKLTKNTKYYKTTRLFNGVYKIGYLCDSFKLFGVKARGDIRHMAEKSDSNVKALIFISAAVDIYKINDSSAFWDLSFWQSRGGAPGLTGSISF